MASSDSLSCECGQVLFDVGNRKAGETLTCPWCSKEYRYLGGTKVERINAKSKSKDEKSKDAKPKAPRDSARKDSAPKESFWKESTLKESVRKEAAPKESSRKETESKRGDLASKETKQKIVLEGADVVLTNVDKETVKMKAFSRRKSSVRDETDEDGETPPPKKKGPSFGEAPGGVFPMLGFMAGFSLLAFVALGALFPENQQHKRSTPWGEPLGIHSPWPELIAMIAGQVMGFIGWGLYIYRLHLRQKAAAAEAAASPEPEKKSEKSTVGSSNRISVRKKDASTRETKRDRRKNDDDDDDDDEDDDKDGEESER